ncbi:hypothetical protein, partial [Larkinella soli]|uniref:hypothetical protein n=1 Tax=Larkinella soli TaxID=1770527 RepID=UPI0013E39078
GDTHLQWNYLHSEDDDLIRFLRQDMPWHTSGVLWKKEVPAALGGWDEKVSSWQDWDLHLMALLSPGLTYFKAEGEVADSYYRVDGSANAISITGYTSRSFETRLYLIDKFSGLLPLERADIRLEFAKLIYRQADQLFRHYDTNLAVRFLQDHLQKLGYSKVFAQLWSAYLRIKLSPSAGSYLKKGVGLVPVFYRNHSLNLNKRTHLTAVAGGGK